MTDFDNTDRGALYRNDRKEKDTHPDYTGHLNVAGRDYRLAAWIKERRGGGGKFMSLSVTPKGEERTAPTIRTGIPAHPDEDIPF